LKLEVVESVNLAINSSFNCLKSTDTFDNNFTGNKKRRLVKTNI
jgi:hypothetical protein